jgi:hypothetical protein
MKKGEKYVSNIVIPHAEEMEWQAQSVHMLD